MHTATSLSAAIALLLAVCTFSTPVGAYTWRVPEVAPTIQADLAISNCAFVGNSADDGGGGQAGGQQWLDGHFAYPVRSRVITAPSPRPSYPSPKAALNMARAWSPVQ